MMRHHCNVLALILLASLISALLSGCTRSTEAFLEKSMTTATPRMKSLFEKTRVVCFGRFVMQIPATAIVVYGPAEMEGPIQHLEGHGDKLSIYLAKRMEEIEEEREFMGKEDFDRLPLFGKIIDGPVPGQKIAIGSKNAASYTMHSFFTKDGDLFIQNFSSSNPTDDILILKRTASHLRLRSEDEIPVEPGSCIKGAFVPLEQEYERVTIGLHFNEITDVRFSVDVHKNQQWLAESGALELMRKQGKELAEQAGLGAIFARIKVLRHQARQIGAWKGVEILSRTPAYKDNTEAHEFRYESLGAVHDPLQPRLDVRLDSGVVKNSKASIKPSITDEEALFLWDKIISTIRVRQPSDATKPADAPGKAPLSTTIPTGAACPHTGFWQCTDLSDIEGTGRQLVNAGEQMPHVVQFGKPSFMQKLMGVRPRYRLATNWKFVAESDAPSPEQQAIGKRSQPA